MVGVGWGGEELGGEGGGGTWGCVTDDMWRFAYADAMLTCDDEFALVN